MSPKWRFLLVFYSNQSNHTLNFTIFAVGVWDRQSQTDVLQQCLMSCNVGRWHDNKYHSVL